MKRLFLIVGLVALSGMLLARQWPIPQPSASEVEEWEGEYFYGYPIADCAGIEIRGDGSFRAWSAGCYSPGGKARGRWAVAGDEIHFHFKSRQRGFLLEFETARRTTHDGVIYLVPKQWEERIEEGGFHAYSCFRLGGYKFPCPPSEE